MKNVLYVNKPKGMTSFDICFKLRKVFNTKSIGHTGTLDPNATGVMVILIDKACKANQFIVTDYKEYVATVLINKETDTLDIDGKVIKESDDLMPNKDKIIEALNHFKGKYLQTPPMTSAIKINGKKLLEYQREGIEVEIPKREVEIKEIELLKVNDDTFTFRAFVSSGTYIRSLAKDILDYLKIIGTLSELNRTKLGNVEIKDCDDLNDIINGKYELHDLYDILSVRYKVMEYEKPADIRNGKHIRLDIKEDEVLFVEGKEVIAIYKRHHGNVFGSVRGLF